MTEIVDRPETMTDPYAITATEDELRRELAAVYRLVAHYRMTDLIFTHISARLATPPGAEPRFLINPYGLMFEEITASSLVVVDLRGEIVEPSPYTVNPAGFVIHSAIHAARPDAHSVLHTHTRAGCAIAATEEGLLPVNQINLEFYGRISYHDYEGIALNKAEQARLVANLGDTNALVLRNHGLLTCGESPLEAFGRMYYLDKACEIQVAAASAGTIRLPTPEVCDYTAAQYRGEAPVDYPDGQGSKLLRGALMRLVERVAPDYAD
jgi:ribulose-5-phosphate 4-epimerase/fuculose-1-phosphate aldolase